LLTNRQFDLSVLLSRVIESLNFRYSQLKAQEFESLKREYLDRMFRFNEFSTFLTNNNMRFIGKIIDVDAFGRLMIETENGELKHFQFKEVEFIL